MHLKDNNDKLMLYGMFLTRLFKYFMSTYPYIQDTQYRLFDRVMEFITKSNISSFFNPERLSIDDLLDEDLSMCVRDASKEAEVNKPRLKKTYCILCICIIIKPW